MHGVSTSKRVVVLYAFVIHLIFVYSTFDVHFQSPLVQGVERSRTVIEAPAKRLVIFVADGARADAAFRRGSARHVQERAERGAWGRRHTKRS